MRQAVEIKWFSECSSIEQAKKLWLKLAMQHHPDHGGDLRSMQEINAEWDYIKAHPFVLPTATPHYAQEKTHKKRTAWKDIHIPSMPTQGAYTCVITDIKDNEAKSYVALVFDIAEGDCKGYFSEFHTQWYKHCIYLKYEEEWQMKNALRIVQVINRSNVGFNGVDALEDNKAYQFIGKRIGIRMSHAYIHENSFIGTEDVFAV